MTRVLVTGATGFVGAPLCAQLLEAGHKVRAWTRGPAASLAPGVEPYAGGALGPGTDFLPALEGVDAVVHLAAHVHRLRAAHEEEAAFRMVNVEATRALAEASAKAGVRRFVFTSSVKAIGEGGPTPYDDDTPCAPQDAYGRSKLDAERALLSSRPDAVILRPPVVYGPRARANVLRLLRTVDRGVPLPLAGVRNARSMIHVDDLVSASQAALDPRVRGGRPYLVDDGAPQSIDALVRRLAALLGRPARLWRAPAWALRAGAALVGRQGDLDRLVGSLVVDSSRFRRDARWTPPVGVDEGWRRTVAWYVAEGRGR